MSRILHFEILEDTNVDTILTTIQEEFSDIPMVFIYDTSYGKNVRHKALIVREWSTGFDIFNIETGRDHWMSDGVDWLFDENDEALSPGTPEFYSAVGEWLKSGYDEIIEAYDLDDPWLSQAIFGILNARDEESANQALDSALTQLAEHGGMFRDLPTDEEKEFRQWARDNYVPGTEVSTLWHPVVQDECRKMNEENK